MIRQFLRTSCLLLLASGAASCSPAANEADRNLPMLSLKVDEVIGLLASSGSPSPLYAAGSETIDGRRYRRWNKGDSSVWIAEVRGQVAAVILEFRFSSLDGLASLGVVMKSVVGTSLADSEAADPEFRRVSAVLAATQDGPATARVAGRVLTAEAISSGGKGRYIRLTVTASPSQAAPSAPPGQ